MPMNHLTVGSVEPPLVKGSLRLYSMRFCPYAQRVHLVLHAKKIQYDPVYINLKKKPEWYVESVPTGKVPAILLDSGDQLFESLIVCEYLDEAFPGPKVFSTDPLVRAKDKILIEMFNQVSTVYYKILFSGGTVPDSAFLPKLFEGFDYFEKELRSRATPFFAGQKAGGVDYMIWPWCERLEVIRILGGAQFKVPHDRFPKMFEWNKAMIEDEVVKSFYVTPELHTKFIESNLSGSPDYDGIL